MFPVEADEMLCFTETWHFIAYDEQGTIIDEWDETYTDCFLIGSGEGGGGGGGSSSGGGGQGGNGTNGCQERLRHISVKPGLVIETHVPDDVALKVATDWNGDDVLADEEWADLEQSGLNYSGFQELLQKRKNNFLLIDRGPLTGGMLVIDPNENGRLERAHDFFVCRATSDGLPAANGAVALAEHDLVVQGGNGDGLITPEDAVWSKLLIWFDDDKNGRPASFELYSLPEMEMVAIHPLPTKRDLTKFHSPMEIQLITSAGEIVPAVID